MTKQTVLDFLEENFERELLHPTAQREEENEIYYFKGTFNGTRTTVKVDWTTKLEDVKEALGTSRTSPREALAFDFTQEANLSGNFKRAK
jgi:hypothetical protein